ncbi:MAG: TolC family protein [Planctomycetota bacterium]
MHGTHAGKRHDRLRAASLAVVCLAGLAAGCTSPNDAEREVLQRSVIDAIRREMIEAERTPDYRLTDRPSTVETLRIPDDRLEELNELSGPGSYEGMADLFDRDLLSEDQRAVRVSLERSIRSAAERNLNLQFQRLNPAVSEADLVQAQAAFDWTFFADGVYQFVDEPITSSTFFGTAFQQIQQGDLSTGLRRQLSTGGNVQFDMTWTYQQNENDTIVIAPDPANFVTVGAQLTQPLLRNAGSDVALAQVRLAENTGRDTVQSLRASLIATLFQTEQAYWNLELAADSLRIQRRLLARGEQVRDIISNRIDLDATQAQIADARAEVENRRADVIRAQRTLRAASDALKVLMNDPELTIGSEIALLPADAAIDEPIRFSLADALTTAFDARPEVAQAIISLDSAGIQRQVAQNGVLPRLDANFEVRYAAIGATPGEAFEEVWDGNFIDFVIGFAFEQPIGNRQANAALRQAQLQQIQAVTSYQNTIQQVTLEVKDALRDVTSNYELIEQTRTARVAAAENLRALQVQIETTGGYTAFNLDQWLTRQQLLALAELEEAQALVAYNIAIAQLYAAIGRSIEHNRIEFLAPDSAELD